jgi:hypothetical protein
MKRVVALAIVVALGACGGPPAPSRLDLIKERAARERDKDVVPLPLLRPPERIRFTGARKPDPFHPR